MRKIFKLKRTFKCINCSFNIEYKFSSHCQLKDAICRNCETKHQIDYKEKKVVSIFVIGLISTHLFIEIALKTYQLGYISILIDLVPIMILSVVAFNISNMKVIRHY